MNDTLIRVAPMRRRLLTVALAALASCTAASACAASFENEWVKGSFDSTISFGMQWRMQGTDCGIIGNDNGGCAPTTGTLGEVVNGPGFGATSNPDFNYLQSDNGNLNYRKNQLISAALKGNHELALRFRDVLWAEIACLLCDGRRDCHRDNAEPQKTSVHPPTSVSARTKPHEFERKMTGASSLAGSRGSADREKFRSPLLLELVRR